MASESKVLDLILKARTVAPSLEGDDYLELLSLASEAIEEEIEEIDAELATRNTIILLNENIMMMLEKFLPHRKDLVTECEKTITLVNQSIVLYKELRDEFTKAIS